MEQATSEQTKKQTAEDKEKSEGFLSRVFLRKKDKKRDMQNYARNICERENIYSTNMVPKERSLTNGSQAR